MQSRTHGIRIELQSTVDSVLLEKYGEAYFRNPKFLAEIVEISPSAEGTIRWNNDRVLEFIPNKPLSSNTLYTISVELDKILEVEKGYETFTFQVATYDQKIEMASAKTQTMDSYNLEWCTVLGSFNTADFADTAKIQKVLTAEYLGKKVPIQIENGSGYNEYDYRIDSLPRQENDANLTLKWNGEPIQSKSSGTKTIKIPSVHDFEMTDWEVQDKDDQIVLLTFSEPINSDQQFMGLIEIEGLRNLNYSVSHNVVSVFLPNRIEGERSLKVSTGIKNIKNHTMKNTYSKTLVFLSPKPRIRIQGEGSILPDSKGLIFPFETIFIIPE